VLVDGYGLSVPELDGLQATRRILAADATARILILTTFDLDDVYEALRAGASGFVLKDDPPRTAPRRNPHRCRRRRAALTGHNETRDQTVHAYSKPTPPNQLYDLTERELDVFRLISRGLSNAEIGREFYISDTTVKTHVIHILQKLNLRDRVQAVILAYETGLFDTDR
jgi:DNA-binding NarL/FixJ family response regulator